MAGWSLVAVVVGQRTSIASGKARANSKVQVANRNSSPPTAQGGLQGSTATRSPQSWSSLGTGAVSLDIVIRNAYNRIHEGCGPDGAAAVEPAEASRGPGAPRRPVAVSAGWAADRAGDRRTCGTRQNGAPASSSATFRSLRGEPGPHARRFPAGEGADLRVAFPPRPDACSHSSLTRTLSSGT